MKQELALHIARLLDTLPEHQREILQLRYTEELSRQEIAEVLGVSVPVVKSRLFEGVKKLKMAEAQGERVSKGRETRC